MIEAINQLDRFEQGFINVFLFINSLSIRSDNIGSHVNTRIIIWLVSCHNEIVNK
jgi:hypothetical protein